MILAIIIGVVVVMAVVAIEAVLMWIISQMMDTRENNEEWPDLD